ncbi:MAG: diguanylate cyclase [Desulfobacterales bacterium]|nr:diguanylate cyclase [Desulfobacterales bacterium]
MKRKLFGVILVWTLGLGISFFWNVQSTLSHREALIFQSARTLFEQMVITRQWNSSYNGVYVKVTDGVHPNIYLKDPQRDLRFNGIFLTKINPSYMTRLVSEQTHKKLGVQFHVTGLNPLRPENRPDTWEKAALESFAKDDLMETGEFVEDEQGEYFRYIKGLAADASCLECHKERGTRLDEVFGGISVKLFNLPDTRLTPVVTGHLIIWAAGLCMILIAGLKLIKAYRTIYDQSVLDGLTQIPNRRYFNERLALEVKRNQRTNTPFSVIMADIDNFKSYNDSYGHAKGDQVLIEVAKAIDGVLCRPLDFCARYGGEEFVVILPDTDEAGAGHIAQLIIDRVRALDIDHHHSDAGRRITLSLGIACRTGVKDDMGLIHEADVALYLAKSNGKNRYELFTGD